VTASFAVDCVVTVAPVVTVSVSVGVIVAVIITYSYALNFPLVNRQRLIC
jgi:hypothetical protein